jgi:heme exporter protein D
MMQFHSWADFLAMGGYGFYVWTAYGVSLLLVAGYFITLTRQRQAVRRRIRRQAWREAQQREARQAGETA